MNSNVQNFNVSPTPSQSWILDNISSLISNQDDDVHQHLNRGKYVNNKMDNLNSTCLTNSSMIQNECDTAKPANENHASKEANNYRALFNFYENDASCAELEVEKSRKLTHYDELLADRILKRPFSPEEIQEFTHHLADHNESYLNENLKFADYLQFKSDKSILLSPTSSGLNEMSLAVNLFNSSELDKSFNVTTNHMLNYDHSPSKKRKSSSSTLHMPTLLEYGTQSYLSELNAHKLNESSDFQNKFELKMFNATNFSNYLNASHNLLADSLKNMQHNQPAQPVLHEKFTSSTPPPSNKNIYSMEPLNELYEPIRPFELEHAHIANAKHHIGKPLNIKKIIKSSSTLFKENIPHQNNANSYFTHSTSYDSIGSLKATSNEYNFQINHPNSKKHHVSDFANSHFQASKHAMSTSYNQQAVHSQQHMVDLKRAKNDKYPNNNNNNNSNNNNNTSIHSNLGQKVNYKQKVNARSQGSTHQAVVQSVYEPTSSNLSDESQLSESNKEQIVLHVKNLDYKISADEWKRILLENFRKHCKEHISVTVATNADKSLLGIVKLASKDDARLAISCLHHKKIGYKRLNVNIAFSSNTNSPKSKIVALLKSNEPNEMPLTRFIELYESRYNQTITVSELFKLKEVIHISQSRDGQGRQIRLNMRNCHNNLENEMQELLHTPYCSLHSIQKQNDTSLIGKGSMNGMQGSAPSSQTISWLPNVIVSLRTFKSAVHKLLNDHGGQMPLLSFLDCYKCCIYNESSMSRSSSSSTGFNHQQNANTEKSLVANKSTTSPYQLIIDNDNGVPLEHLITCAQDVQIQFNQGFFKQLQWENDKTKPMNFQGRNLLNKKVPTCLNTDKIELDFHAAYDGEDSLLEESQRKINQFCHEVVELFKGVSKCIIPLSKFNNEYHKKYGKQCRVADYGYTKLYELLESIPHILQVVDGEFEKKLTLTHRVQVRRFSNDIIKVLKANPSKQMFAEQYPFAYEKHFSKTFDIRDYGVCYLEDMLAELPESIICRKEIDGNTFIQIPKIAQLEEERQCTNRLTLDIIDMLKHKPRFSIQFNKFIPNFHHHFGRQCKLSNYGFTKLIELLEAIPDTVQILIKDSLQFVQLKQEIMLDLICQNLVKLIEENNYKLKLSTSKLEELYNSKYQPIFFSDFNQTNFYDLFMKLPFEKNFIKVSVLLNASEISELKSIVKENSLIVNQNINLASCEWLIEVEKLNEREVKRVCKLVLKKLMDSFDETVLSMIHEFNSKNMPFTFNDFCDLTIRNNKELVNYHKLLNNRSYDYVYKCLNDYLAINDTIENTVVITGLSDMYYFAKQIRNVFKVANLHDMTFIELESVYKKAHNANSIVNLQTNENGINSNSNGSNNSNNNNGANNRENFLFRCSNGFPYKQLGFIDTYLLFSQGLNLIVSVKKYTDKRICLNKEFWPASFLEVTPSISPDQFQSPQSPIKYSQLNDSQNTTADSTANDSTPLSQRFNFSNSLNYENISESFFH